MIVLKLTKFQHFSGNDRTVFKISSIFFFGYYSLPEDKVDMCVNINDAYTSSDLFRHLHLQQNLQRAQNCIVARFSWIEGHGCLATAFCSLSFFILCIVI
jgi:hypothetical protein